MKEYRLASWPELGGAYDRTAFRRMLSDMSQRHMSLTELKALSGLRKQDVQRFVEMLDRRGLLEKRDCVRQMLLTQWLVRIKTALGAIFNPP